MKLFSPISQLLNLVVIGWIIRSFSVFLAVALVVIFRIRSFKEAIRMGKAERESEKAAERAAAAARGE